MDSTAKKQSAVRKHAQSLLTSIGVSRIIVVDDEYRRLEVEELIGLCSVLASDEAGALPHLDGINFQADQAIWTGLVREKWETLDQQGRERVLARGRALQPVSPRPPNGNDSIDPQPGQDDTQAAESLEETLDQLDGCEYVTLSLGEWRAQGNDLLSDDRAKNTVFLFDKDFTKEDGTKDEGMELVRQVQTGGVGFCGLLSHTVPVKGEHNAQMELSETYGLDAERFIVIAKERLTDDPLDHYQFLRMLRFIGLSKRYAIVKSTTWSVFEKSVAEAETAVERLSVSDFDRIVFESSRREGVWEPDTLLRVFGILMRREARKRLRQDEEILSAVSEARGISAMSEELANAMGTETASQEALRIQRYETYELGEELNRFQVPIDVGDIFRDIRTSRPYILLTQPCDLMVREDGKRSYDGKDGRMGALVELVFDGKRKLVFDGKKEKESWGRLPFYHEDTGGSAFADFARAHHALLAILDLCVLRADGVVEIDVDAACPALLIQPWKARYERLGTFFRRALDRCDKLERKRVKKSLRLLTLPRLSATIGIQGTASDRTVHYGLERVTRLRQPWSGALLTAFAQYQARAAFEHPFERRVQTQLEACGKRECEDALESGTTA